MQYELQLINNTLIDCPEDYIHDCEDSFKSQIRLAADDIVNNLDKSPIVLLSGPSASGKTTTAKKLSMELVRLGMTAPIVSLDNYFLDMNPLTAPRTPEGDVDYESPLCLDMSLLCQHFQELAEGKEVTIPHFNFAQQCRDRDLSTPMRLGPNDVAIFEGIHALNDQMTEGHVGAYRIYVSTLSDITDDGDTIIDRAGLRLIRRLVRDNYFRGTDPEATLKMWDNVRRGELLNILPYKDTANVTIDSALPYELGIMKRYTREVLGKIPQNAVHYDALQKALSAFDRVCDVDSSLVPEDSILREFIGGSCFEY